MSPAALLQAAATIYALPSYQGIPMTPTIAVDIARRMAKDIERFERVYAEVGPVFEGPRTDHGIHEQNDVVPVIRAAHGVADPEGED